MPRTNEKIYFSPDLSERERACFEAGIKLGALYHILCGIPIASDEKIINSVENGIETAISCQPFVQSVKITLDKGNIKGNKSTEFDYDIRENYSCQINCTLGYHWNIGYYWLDWRSTISTSGYWKN